MRELTISLDGESKTPLYEQIYQHLKMEIQKRQILPGECLPSTRALSRYLQVSRSTVDLAYMQLMSEGYIESIPYRGYFVCELEGIYQFPEEEAVPDEKKPGNLEEYVYDFAVNGIDAHGFPQNQWRKISKEILQQDDTSLFQLGDPQGEWELRQVLASYLHHARGVHCTPGQIIVGAGNDYLLMLLRVILGQCHVIAMENPTYKSAYQGFLNLEYQVCSIAMDDAGMRIDELEKSGADIAYVMPSHQFPMGNVMPVKRRMQLLSWADDAGERYIIEDDYDSEFRYRGKPIPALQGYDSHQNVIYLGTFSKSIAPAIRISYMVLPEKLVKRYGQCGSNFSATVSKVDQRIIELLIRDGHYERHLNRMRALYKGKHDVLLAELKQMTDICRVFGENAGVHVGITFTRGMTEQEAVERAAAQGVHIYGLSAYDTAGSMSPEESRAVILGYATLSEEEIRQGMNRLCRAWK